MIIATSNCHGAGNRHFPTTLKNMVKEHKIDVFCLVETRISGIRAYTVVRKLGFHNWLRLEASGFAGGIWVLWNKVDTDVEYLASDIQFLHCRLTDRRYSSCNLVTFVYA